MLFYSDICVTDFKMNRFCRGAVTVILLTIFTFTYVPYNSNILHFDNESPSHTLLHTAVGVKFRPKYQFGNIQNSTREFACKVGVVENLTSSGLRKIQKERKSRIKDVCDVCRRNRTSMECNHVTLDDDEHYTLMYYDLLVDEMHKVCGFFFQKRLKTEFWQKVLIILIPHMWTIKSIDSLVGLLNLQLLPAMLLAGTSLW